MDTRFIPIETQEHLPKEGTVYETRMFDMKLRQNSGNDFEKAKDVAAFASAYGGVILVGACEDRPTGQLHSYRPLTADEAKQTSDGYVNAVHARCKPTPLVDPRIIPFGTGYVVAINIWPFPGQAVGVKIQSNKGDGKEIDAWTFPIRSGNETQWLNPEQTAMFMSPEIRRIATLLNRIPLNAGVKISLFYESVEPVDKVKQVLGRPQPNTQAPSAPKPSMKQVSIGLVNYNLLDNNFVVRLNRKPESQEYSDQSVPFAIPIDSVISIWKQNEQWCIAVSGSIIDQPHDGVTIYSPFQKMD